MKDIDVETLHGVCGAIGAWSAPIAVETSYPGPVEARFHTLGRTQLRTVGENGNPPGPWRNFYD